jgi:S-adenosylmethionine:tRNA ribosyltransferase-isomerase
MHDPRSINIKDYTYTLPEDRIAQFPLEKRDESKLLIYKNGDITDEVFKNLHQHLPPNSLLVFNNTRVIHARILFERTTGAQIEVFCIEPLAPADYALVFTTTKSCTWKCMVGNAKRWKNDLLQKEVQTPTGKVKLDAELHGRIGDLFVVKFSWDDDRLSFGEVLHYAGILPIPPYLNRERTDEDEERYQTIYAKQSGSVAAPTAGLHFTEAVFQSLQAKQIELCEVTLHVGAGTFKPVKTDSLKEHDMHEESIYVSKAAIEKLLHTLNAKHPITAVGTTSVRTLESIYWLGIQLINGKQPDSDFYISQWEPYENGNKDVSTTEALQAITDYMTDMQLEQITGATQIIIAPGYRFRLADMLITNFHQPENTLILLIAALVGNDWRKIYEHALSHQYRFLSYGDSSLLHKNDH